MAIYGPEIASIVKQEADRRREANKKLLNTIVEETNTKYTPTLTESDFKRHALGLLENLFHPNILLKWREIVGETTLPLRVVSDSDHDELLFVVPPMSLPPPTSVVDKDGLDAGKFMAHEMSQAKRHGVNSIGVYAKYFDRAVDMPDREQRVYIALMILDRYGRGLKVPNEDGGYDVVEYKNLVKPTKETASSSTDEQEEDDYYDD